MHVRCPHCQNAIELVEEASLKEVICPSCGSSFNLTADTSTVTYGRERPRAVAHFELLEQVGLGAFGSVWKARDTQLDRNVAVKIPRSDQLDESGAEQFLREARAAAQLRHQHIVSVHEVGRDDGTLYIASDFVNGATLAEWIKSRRLSPREAAELCIPIAEALQHAHEKGVVHRDLKPTNIMMDLSGRPYLTDFGLAKREAGEITMTVEGRVLGTPAYMSPEQARGEAHQADARSDVYSLGVILFELFTGELPFRGSQRMLIVQILQDEPPSPRRLNSAIPRDLETITLKCLEKDPKRRYQSAAEVVAELRRYLAGHPIVARPIGRVQRAWRWTRRNPALASLAASVLVGLIASSALALWAEKSRRDAHDAQAKAIAAQAAEAKRADAERQANIEAQAQKSKAEAAAKTERAARQKEERERKYAQAIADFVRDDFFALTSVEGQDRFADEGKATLSKDTTLSELLDRAAAKLDQRKDLDPRIEAELRWIIGVNYRGRGDVELAVPHLNRCVELRRHLLGAGDAETLRAKNSLALAYQYAGKLDLALPLYEETLKLRRANLGADHPSTLTSMNNLAGAYLAAEKLDLALPLYEETLKLRRARLGADHPSTLTSMNNLARAYRRAGKLNMALTLFEATLKLCKAKFGANHPNTLTSMDNLAGVHRASRKLDLALPLYEETLKLRKSRLGVDHPGTLASMNNLAMAYQDADKLDLALPLYEKAAAGIEKRKFQHDYAGPIIGNTAACHERLKQFAQAEAWRRKWLAVVRQRDGADSLQYARELLALGLNVVAQNKFTDAELVLRECLAIWQKEAPDDWTTFNTQSMLGGALAAQRKYPEAEPLLVAGYEGMKQRQEKIPPQAKFRLVEAAQRLVVLYEAWQKPDEAARSRATLAELRPATPTKPPEP